MLFCVRCSSIVVFAVAVDIDERCVNVAVVAVVAAIAVVVAVVAVDGGGGIEHVLWCQCL